MKEATRIDAIAIAHLLDVDKESVWKIIKGMSYSTYEELEMAVHEAFLGRPAKAEPVHQVRSVPVAS